MATTIDCSDFAAEKHGKLSEELQPRGSTPSSSDAVRQNPTPMVQGEKRDVTLMSRVNSASPVSYFYLTFNTVLPKMPSPQQAGYSVETKIQSCPDLKAYISPLKWSPARKNVSLALSCIATFLTAYSAGCYSPPVGAIAHDLNSTRIVTLVGLTTFCLDFAIAPMALAPISEIWGRFPSFIIAGVVFVVFQAVCSAMTQIAGLLVARFFVGAGASVFSSVVGGVIADLWDKSERNTPMALFSGFVLAGTGSGPLVGSAFMGMLGQTSLAWKWTFWHQVILDGALLLSLIFFFKESRSSVLLTKKAEKLNQWYGDLEGQDIFEMYFPNSSMPIVAQSASSSDSFLSTDATISNPDFEHASGEQGRLVRIRWVVEEDEKRPPMSKIIATSVTRPFYMLFTKPVVFCFSL